MSEPSTSELQTYLKSKGWSHPEINTWSDPEGFEDMDFLMALAIQRERDLTSSLELEPLSPDAMVP